METKDINEAALYVLRLGVDNRLYTDYISIGIPQLLEEVGYEAFCNELAAIKPDINKEDSDNEKNAKIKLCFDQQLGFAKHYYDTLLKTIHFNRENSYAIRLSEAYGNLYPSINVLNEKQLLRTSDCKWLVPINNNTYITLEKWFYYVIHSYAINEAYKKCSNDTEVKAYSHRKVGWQVYEYSLGNTLSAIIKTNFAFGYSAYFFVVMKYKGVQICPYSKVVHYRQVDITSIVQYSQQYYPDNKEWEATLNYVKDAHNYLLNNGEDEFINLNE